MEVEQTLATAVPVQWSESGAQWSKVKNIGKRWKVQLEWRRGLSGTGWQLWNVLRLIDDRELNLDAVSCITQKRCCCRESMTGADEAGAKRHDGEELKT